MSMAVNFWCYGSIQGGTLEWIEPQFTGWPYYKMAWKGTAAMTAELQVQADRITSGKILEGSENEPYRKVKGLLDRLKEPSSATP